MDDNNEIVGHSVLFLIIRDWADLISKFVTILGVIGIFIAARTLIWTVRPQLISGNDDLTRKANAGDIISQMQLAEHYYEVGEYDDAIYWYKIASTHTGEYQPIACNNLGFLYAKGYGLADESGMEVLRYPKALRLFAVAYDAGQATADNELLSIIEDNGEETLRCFWDECNTDSDIDSETMSAWRGIANSKKAVSSQSYKSFKTYKGKTYHEGDTYYTYSGPYDAPSENGGFPMTYHMYYGVTYEPNTKPYDPQFIPLSMLSDVQN